MRKLDLKLLPKLPALLGWLFFFLSLCFFLFLLFTSNPAHAEGLTCVQHKNFLGLRDGWDCTAPASTVVLSLQVAPGIMVRCTEDGSTCKSTGNARLQVDGDTGDTLSALERPRRFEFAAECFTKPGSALADCKFSSKGEDAEK
jgi:hypothetical protein